MTEVCWRCGSRNATEVIKVDVHFPSSRGGDWTEAHWETRQVTRNVCLDCARLFNQSMSGREESQP